MGRGSSGAGGGGGGGGGAKTPSGITLDDFRNMDESQQIQTIDKILNDRSIVVPGYLDGSDTTKLMYALGMNGKPDVVDDDVLDTMPGTELFRTVYEMSGGGITSQDITDQIRHGEYTQMSGAGGSVLGRGLYFATTMGASAVYGRGRVNPITMRAKVKPGSRMSTDSRMDTEYGKSKFTKYGYTDGKAMLAIAKGYAGWYDSFGYDVVLDRSILVASKTNKHSLTRGGNAERSWGGARTAP